MCDGVFVLRQRYDWERLLGQLLSHCCSLCRDLGSARSQGVLFCPSAGLSGETTSKIKLPETSLLGFPRGLKWGGVDRLEAV